MRAVAVPPIDIANAISDALKIELKRQIERERDSERKREQEIELAGLSFYGNRTEWLQRMRVQLSLIVNYKSQSHTIKLRMIQITNFECFYRISFGWISFGKKSVGLCFLCRSLFSIYPPLSLTRVAHSNSSIRSVGSWYTRKTFCLAASSFRCSFFSLC